MVLQFVSIGKHLWEGEGEVARSLHNLAAQLLTAVSRHVVVLEPNDAERFRSNIQSLERKLEAVNSLDEIKSVGPSAEKAIQAYNGEASGRFRAQREEFHQMVLMLAKTLAEVSTGSETAAARMQQIAQQIESACRLEDVRLLRANLATSLASLRAETVRQRETLWRAVAKVQQELDEVAERVRPKGDDTLDQVVRLPGRKEAEDRLRLARAEKPQSMVAAFAIDNWSEWSQRFGKETGELMLSTVAGNLLGRVGRNDQLYRWNSGALLGVFEGLGPAEFQAELAHWMARRLEIPVRAGAREVRLPVITRWTVLPVTAEESHDKLITRLDKLTAVH